MNFLVSSETSKLKSVIIGIANSNGKTPHIDDLYDPKSIENLKKGTYPKAVSYTHLTLPTILLV